VSVRDPSLVDVRDGVLLVEYPEASEEVANRAAVLLARRLTGGAQPGILDAIPAARSLLVIFDGRRLSRGRLGRELSRLFSDPSDGAATGRLIRIPVAYGGPFGPDLGELARQRGMPEMEFARRHAAAQYRVAFIGFAPGFPYMVGLPEELRAPRLPSPRPRVAAGSVAIAAAYSGIYPAETPGGWRLIGRTSVPLFDPAAEPPALLAAGDAVRFEGVRSEDLPVPRPNEPSIPRGRPILRVRTAGVFSSVQAAPRYGLGPSGVPAGGAMDTASLARANALVGNGKGQGALEISLVGPELESLGEATVAIAGADFSAEWNGRPAPFGEPFRIATGDRLRFGRVRSGARAYLALAGGLEVSFGTRRIGAGEVVGLGLGPLGLVGADATPVDFSQELRLRVVPGPQSGHFAPDALERFLTQGWRVSPTSDRRGLRLEGESLVHARPPEIAPEGVVFGSIQVPGGGSPIVVGPDGPVTGGYPKIATVVGPDLPRLGQAAPGAVLRFSAASLQPSFGAPREYH